MSAPSSIGRLQVGRREGVVDHQQGAGFFGHGRGGGNVNDVQQRVGGRFHPDQLGALGHGGFHGRHVVHGHEVEVDAVGGVHLREEAVGAAVQVVGANHFVAGLKQLHNAVDGGHPGGEGQAVLAVIEGGQRVLELAAGGVVGARVFEALVLAGRGLHVGGSLIYGRHDGPGGGVRMHAGVDGFGSEFHTGCGVSGWQFSYWIKVRGFGRVVFRRRR